MFCGEFGLHESQGSNSQSNDCENHCSAQLLEAIDGKRCGAHSAHISVALAVCDAVPPRPLDNPLFA